MDCDFDSLLKYSLRILGKRDYTFFQIKEKLEKRCKNSKIVESVLEKLVKINALDDERYAKNFFEIKISRGWGPKKIKFELFKKGIPQKIIEKYEEVYTFDKREENLKKNIEKWIRIKGDIGNEKNFDRLYEHLYRLGFDSDEIIDILKIYKKNSGE